MTEDEMLGWHHRLDGHEFEQDQGVGDGQGSLAFCSPWGCKRVLRVLWTARRSNQSILKEISPEYSLKGVMLKLKPRYFGYLM